MKDSGRQQCASDSRKGRFFTELNPSSSTPRKSIGAMESKGVQVDYCEERHCCTSRAKTRIVLDI
jgi:hypothetical protein